MEFSDLWSKCDLLYFPNSRRNYPIRDEKRLKQAIFSKKHEKRLIFLSKYSIIRLYL